MTDRDELLRLREEREMTYQQLKFDAKYYEYLDVLRDTGVTNMYGAGPYLENAFALDKKTARAILLDWMQTFTARFPRKDEEAS